MMRLGRLPLLAVGLVLSGLTALAGCSQGSQPAHAPDLSILAGTQGAGDFVVSDSPEEMVTQFDPDVIVIGAVEGIEQGPEIYSTDDPDPMHYIVMQVQVDQTLRAGKPGQIHDGHVYVPLYQGPIYETTRKPSPTLDQWRQAIPSGTRLMLFARDWSPSDERVENADRGHPSGSHLLAVFPQGMIFEYNGKIIDWEQEQGPGPVTSTWNVQSIDDIATQVKAYLKTHD